LQTGLGWERVFFKQVNCSRWYKNTNKKLNLTVYLKTKAPISTFITTDNMWGTPRFTYFPIHCTITNETLDVINLQRVQDTMIMNYQTLFVC